MMNESSWRRQRYSTHFLPQFSWVISLPTFLKPLTLKVGMGNEVSYLKSEDQVSDHLKNLNIHVHAAQQIAGLGPEEIG